MTVLIVLMVAIVMVIIEKFGRGRSWNKVKGWYLRAFLLNACQALIVFSSTFLWSEWFKDLPIFSIEHHLGIMGAALMGYFLITFIFYWWHRARHEIPFLWVKLHQIHHSAQRLEILTAFYKHPFEILINSIFMSFVMYSFLGMGPESAAITTLMTGIAELFYHWNVKTPRWIGYFFQRPESHCIHHKRGWHTQNYSDLPLWDILFGTFNNPSSFNGACGFKENRETFLKQMLLGKDINPPK